MRARDFARGCAAILALAASHEDGGACVSGFYVGGGIVYGRVFTFKIPASSVERI